jgi:hypothetical protein
MVKSVMEVVTLQRLRDTQIVIVISNSRFTLHGSGIENWVALVDIGTGSGTGFFGFSEYQ